MSRNFRAPDQTAATPLLPTKRKATLGDTKVDSMIAVASSCKDLAIARDALYEATDVLKNDNASKSRRVAAANNLKKVQQHLDQAITPVSLA